ncbi:MAG: response regulator [Proteobacteria bacterium]|nr:response regulator [Pseudomonadota bacterium]
MDHTRTILIVDDVSIFRELGALFLARSGRVLTAEDAMRGWELVECHRPDLVICDLEMPGADGASLCRRIKQHPEHRPTPVVLMLGTNTAEARARAVRAGADDLLGKPISRVHLIETVNRYLRYEVVRGLPRVDLDVPVRLVVDGGRSALPAKERWGTLRNVSRDGVFVEMPETLEPRTEVELQFALPDAGREFASTALVVWRSDRGVPGLEGMGLRFLDIDSDSAHALEDYVLERSVADARPGLPPSLAPAP